MSHKPAEIEKMLTNKLKMVSDNKDHEWFTLHIEGLPPIRTKLSHHKGDVSDVLEGKMCKQLRVHKSFFVELISCTKSREAYIEKVTKDPYPPFSQIIV